MLKTPSTSIALPNRPARMRAPGRFILSAAVAVLTLVGLAPVAGAVPFTPLAAEAIAFVQADLLNTDCEKLIDGTKDNIFGQGSRDILPRLLANDRIVEMWGSDGIANTTGVGERATIHLLEGFYSRGYVADDYRPLLPTSLSNPEVRRVILLHELAHATRALGDDREPGGDIRARQFNRRIVNTCIAPKPKVGALRCEQDVLSADSYPLGSAILCSAECSGGLEPYAFQWSDTEVLYEQGEQVTDAFGCTITRVASCPTPSVDVFFFQTYPPVDITLTVTDALGQSISATSHVECQNTNYGW